MARQWGITPLLWGISRYLQTQTRYQRFGALLYGFSWCWGAGSLYWGWLRWEPLWHLPVEALPLPLMVWHLRQRQQLVGVFFFLGSFLGTAITDAYFYLIDVIPHWRAIMYLEQDLVSVQEMLVQAIARYPYLKPTGTGQIHKVSCRVPWDFWPSGLVLSLMSVILPLSLGQLLYLHSLGLLLMLLVPAWFYHQVGGHTGDTYGAVVEWNEALMLVGLSVAQGSLPPL